MESDWLLKRCEEGGRAPHVNTATLIDGDIGESLGVVLKFQTGSSRLDLPSNNQHRAAVEQAKRLMNRAFPFLCTGTTRQSLEHKSKQGWKRTDPRKQTGVRTTWIPSSKSQQRFSLWIPIREEQKDAPANLMAQTQSVELNYKWMAFVSIGLLKPASHISSGLALQTTP